MMIKDLIAFVEEKKKGSCNVKNELYSMFLEVFLDGSKEDVISPQEVVNHLTGVTSDKECKKCKNVFTEVVDELLEFMESHECRHGQHSSQRLGMMA